MTTVSPHQLPPCSALDQVELALTLELDPDSPTALLRPLVLLQRRRCRVTTVHYHAEASGGDSLELRVQAPPAHAHCLEAWLSALRDVRRVSVRSGAASASGAGGGEPAACINPTPALPPRRERMLPQRLQRG